MGKFGSPPPTNTDAAQDSSRAAYPSTIVANKVRGAGKFAFIHIEGTTTRAHPAPKAGTARRATVGSCRCRSRATRVAIPPACSLAGWNYAKLTDHGCQGVWLLGQLKNVGLGSSDLICHRPGTPCTCDSRPRPPNMRMASRRFRPPNRRHGYLRRKFRAIIISLQWPNRLSFVGGFLGDR